MKFIIFGDSISVGQYVFPHMTWASRLSGMIEEIGTICEKQILVQIEAINGRTTRQALEDIPVEVQKHAPDIVMVQFGMNDCNYWITDQGMPRVSKGAFEQNLKEILERCFNFNARHIFLNTNHPSARNFPLDAKPEISYQNSNEAYNQIIRNVAADYSKEKLTLTDMEAVFLNDFEVNSTTYESFVLPSPDLLHLNLKGHDLYYSTLSDVVKQKLLQLIE